MATQWCSLCSEAPASRSWGDTRFCRPCCLRARWFFVRHRKSLSTSDWPLLDRILPKVLSLWKSIRLEYTYGKIARDFDDLDEALDAAAGEFSDRLPEFLRKENTRQHKGVARWQESPDRRRGMTPDVSVRNKNDTEPQAYGEDSMAIGIGTTKVGVCSVCRFSTLSPEGKSSDTCVFCSVWKKKGRMSDDDARAATPLFTQYFAAIFRGGNAAKIVHEAMREAERVIARAERSHKSPVAWLTDEIAKLPHCCFCEEILTHGGGENFCRKHEEWFSTFVEKCEDRFPEGTDLVALARETASAWREWRATDPQAPEAAIWGEFMQEEIQPRSEEAWGSSAEIEKPVVEMAGRESAVSATSSPTPTPAPVQSNPLPSRALSPLQGLNRKWTGADKQWVWSKRNHIEQFLPDPTRDDFDVIMAHRDAWVAERTDKRGRSARIFFIRYLTEGIPEIAKEILSRRETPAHSAVELWQEEIVAGDDTHAGAAEETLAAPPELLKGELQPAIIDVSHENVQRIRVNIQSLVDKLGGLKCEAEGVVRVIEELQAELFKIKEEASL